MENDYLTSNIPVNIPQHLYDHDFNPSEQIRLLGDLQREYQNDERDYISGKLKIVSFQEPGDYWAISHRWGIHKAFEPLPNIIPIFIDGIQVFLPINLHRQIFDFALMEQRDVPLWIDNICINQKDIAEKQIQLALMGDIYAKATSTVIYLPFAEIGRTLSAFHVLSESLDHLPESDAVSLFENTPQTMIDWITSSLMNEDHHDAWDFFLDRFICDEYWSRGWIVQEIVRSDHPLLFCGDRLISMTVVFQIVRGCHIALENMTHTRKTIEAIDNLASLRSIALSWLSYRKDREKAQNLVELLDTFFEQKVTVPRDIFYCLHGISEEPQGGLHMPINLLCPDSEVLHSMAVYIMRRSKRLDYLSYCDISMKVGSDLPSWVPFWPNTTGFRLNPTRRLMWKRRFDLIPGNHRDNDGEHFSFADNDRELQAIGVIFGTIDGVHNIESFRPTKKLKSIYAQCIINVSNLAQFVENYSDGRIKESLPSFTDDVESFLKSWAFRYGVFLSVFQASMSDIRGKMIDPRRIYHLFDDTFKKGNAESGYYYEFTEEEEETVLILQRAFESSTLVHLEFSKGKHEIAYKTTTPFAICMNQAEEGDVIALIAGCWSPLLLRPLGPADIFKVLGIAFMDTRFGDDTLLPYMGELQNIILR